MKLAKKMLASVFALAMVAALALTAFAAPAINVTATDAVVGGTITVKVAATGVTGLESGDLILNYDPAVLEFVKVTPNAAGGFTPAAGSPAAGEVTFSFMYLEHSTAADVDFMEVEFKVLKAGDAKLSLVLASFDGVDGDVAINVNKVEAESEVADDKEDNKDDDKGDNKLPNTGDVGVAAIAGVMAIAAVAFVATRKKDEE